MIEHEIEKKAGDPMRRGRIETVTHPRQEAVTISIDSLGHWPRELGSLDLDEVVAKLTAAMDKDLERMFSDMFTDLFPPRPDPLFVRWPRPGPIHGVQIDGA